MKRPLAVLLIACLVASCRSSQPTTNPFLRTTVPPPTTPGVVVTPGQPYAAGISPPMVTSPAPPVVTTPPVVTQPMPVAPAPAPLAPPPSVAPQGDQFHPPGGSFLFNQSSNQPQPNPTQLNPGQSYPVQQATHLAANAPTSGPVTQVAFAAPAVAAPQTTAPPANGIVVNPYVQSSTATLAPAALPPAALPPAPLATVPTGRGDPPEARASLAVGGAQPQNTIRILGPSPIPPQPIAIPAAPAPPASANTPVIKLTVGGNPSSLVTTVPGASAPATASPATASNLSIGASTAAQNTAQFVAATPAGSGVVQTAFQPAAGGAKSDYAHSPDYSMLRGKLEYSQSLRQWKLRYIPIDGRTDDFGGSVVLDDSPALATCKPGDFVAVRGLLSGSGAKASGYAPRYLITAIERTSR